MEHPYLLFVKLFEMFGLEHFAAGYKHVIYSWVVMILLIILGALGAKNVSMIPGKGQNIFEIIVLFELPIHLNAAFSGHGDIQYDQSRFLAEGLSYAFIFIARIDGFVTAVAQQVAQKNPHIQFVINDQYFFSFLFRVQHCLREKGIALNR